MKEFQKGILDNERVISAENVQRMGEVIALCCIKTVIARSGKDLHKLYADLLHDINREKDDYSPFSNAYDLAQEAMLFLCQHMGKRLDDVYVTKTGRKITIKQACFRYTDRYLDKQYTRHMANTVSLNEKIATKLETIPADEQKNDYTAFDRLISKMKLTAVEYETLSILMAGFTLLQIGRILNVNRSTIWRRQNSIRKKYLQATNAL
ncbi:MAG: helix-turn-helix transcriptional regulator [Ruminococcus sp.]